HDKVVSFFHIPGAHEASEGGQEAAAPATAEAPVEHAATPAAEGEHAAPAAEGEHAAPAAEGEGGGEAEHAAVAAPVGGAIYMAPDNHIMTEAHEAPAWVKVSPFIAMLLGLIVSWFFYIADPSLPGRLAAQQRGLYQFLLNKWYFDEIYQFIFVRPTLWLGNVFWKKGDGDVIDGTINGVAMGLIPRLTRAAVRVQSGYLFHYAFAMVLGIVGLLIWVMMRGAH
ncbi:MAG: NADH-quinone oxidoreductase subunit L, partial [Paracoccus sp.]|nr:NADH-quinone oxidoreductase subunit L [Paracoccus sp. (in: a-proteobacteria)]